MCRIKQAKGLSLGFLSHQGVQLGQALSAAVPAFTKFNNLNSQKDGCYLWGFQSSI